MTAASTAGHAAQVSRTLVTVLAHADDEGPIAPVLARYAREGVQVSMIVVTDGSASAGQQGHIPRPEVASSSGEVAAARAEEARCAAQALGLRHRSSSAFLTAGSVTMPVESMRAMNPQRGALPLVVPQARYFTARVSFAPQDFAAAKRSMACHRTQFTPEVVERVKFGCSSGVERSDSAGSSFSRSVGDGRVSIGGDGLQAVQCSGP